MKRVVAWILGVCMLLGGCGVIHDSKGVGQDVSTSVLDISGLDSFGSIKKVAVYFLNSTSGTLTADLRQLVIEQDTNPAEAAVKALLAGPSNDSLTPVAPEGMTLDSIEYSNGVANVYLIYDGTPMESKDNYIMEMAIANTVADLLGATSVNVFYNNIRNGFQGYPSAPLKKQTVSVDEAYASASAKYIPTQPVSEEDTDTESAPILTTESTEIIEEEPKTSDISTVLYFVSTTGDYILPEVRTVTYTTSSTDDNFASYISSIISALKVGPKNTTAMKSPLETGSLLVGNPVKIDNGDGTYDVELHFDTLPSGTAYTGSNEMLLTYAALVYSITGFMPNVKAVHIYVEDTLLTVETRNGGDGTQRSDFFGYIGSSAPLYFQYESSGLLIEVSRSMEQGEIWSALERVRALIRGPQNGDISNINPVINSDMMESDILSIKVSNDMAYADLSADFKEACQGLSEKNEMLLVYAIVNTITSMDGINRVQFLVEGGQTDTLAGHLCISDPFLRNYGIIKNSG